MALSREVDQKGLVGLGYGCSFWRANTFKPPISPWEGYFSGRPPPQPGMLSPPWILPSVANMRLHLEQVYP